MGMHSTHRSVVGDLEVDRPAGGRGCLHARDESALGIGDGRQRISVSESIPEPAVLAGKPQGIFVGRSLLTGRAVCLLFLTDGRVTRSIPYGGFEQFDWARHLADHPGDSGTWEQAGGQLSIAWGDGGVHQGPLTVLPTGIEFYGKRYSRPMTVMPSDLVGRWESASGTALAGGEGINSLSTLIVETDGRYRWNGTVGGVVAGQATTVGRSSSGTVVIAGQTMTFAADDGSTIARSFLPFGGEPVEAFSLDADMFTRTG